MAFDVFISYSSKDAITANAACATLESAGIRCWIAPRDIRPGLEYGAAIIEGIDSCRIMVLIFSSNANASLQVHREIERAVSKALTIIPFRIEEIAPTKAMEYYLGAIHWLDALTPPLAKHLQQLTETVKAILQVDPTGTPASVSILPQITPKRAATFLRSKPWSLMGGVTALVVLVAGALVIWEKPDVLPNLFHKPAPAATVTQQILLNILRASYDEPLDFSPSALSAAMQRSINLGELNAAIRQGYPREMLFWLFIDSFELIFNGQTVGYHFAPPDDYGCNIDDPKHRCFIDWVHIATLTGLTVEEKTLAGVAANPTTTSFARFCFNPVLAQQAKSTMPLALVATATNDLPVPIAAAFAPPTRCGGPWDPMAAAGQPQPDILPVTVGPITFRIIPRSAYGVFKFLGTLVKVQRAHLAPSAIAYIPPGRNDVVESPMLLTVHDDVQILTILQNRKGNCFVETRFSNADYCVPNEAATTKRAFDFLTQLIQGRAQ